jgi:alpha-amylase
MVFSPALLLFLACLPSTFAATAEQWRGRSIYQIITDRFALPAGSDLNACDPGKQTWCGGTWNTIRENLDYVQNAGFTAIWISPVNQNYAGPRTAYGDSYHGYWSADLTQLNDRFGTADDLKALSAEVHRRNMYLMVDVVVNNVMATSTTPDFSKYMFKDKSLYHPYCPVKWGNTTSEQECWLGDEKVPLPDLDTRNPTVIAGYGDWVRGLVTEYNIDGLRIDAAKHVNTDFWPPFCAKAGVFCIGEVFGGIDVKSVAQYQGPNALDSVLNFPMYTALMQAFKIPGPRNMSAVTDVLEQSKVLFKDTSLLGNFLENQDLPRWHNQSVDIQSLFNAMVFTFMSDGIPIVYYGQEQGFSGNSDPFNREPLWPSKYTKGPTYQLIATLNQFRNFLVNKADWVQKPTEVLTSSPHGIAILKGSVISVMTNIGSPAQNNTNIAVHSPFEASTSTTNILDCEQWAVGANGMLDVEYTKGGMSVILAPTELLAGSGLCGTTTETKSGAKGGAQQSNVALPLLPTGLSMIAKAIPFLLFAVS